MEPRFKSGLLNATFATQSELVHLRVHGKDLRGMKFDLALAIMAELC